MMTRTIDRALLCRALAATLVLIAMTTAGPAVAQPPADRVRAEDLDAAGVEAQRELENARAAVAKARAGATAAKAALEAAVAASKIENTGESAYSKPASTTPHQGQSSDPSWASALQKANRSEVESLQRLIAELKAERRKLSTYLTARHPLIVDADLRIEEYEQQLATLAVRPAPHASPADADTIKLAVPQSPTPSALQADDNRRSEAARRLDATLQQWESAQQALEAAMDAESAAAERLAALAAERREVESSEPVVVLEPTPAAPPVAAVTDRSPPRESAGSQPLVLAALIAALVVAAAASVKLARWSDNNVFAGADDAAAALSLPVVGVIPATTHTMARPGLLRRFPALLFLLQMLLAVAVFAAVAYVVQSPALRF